MGSKWALVFLILMSVPLEGWCNQGQRCWEQERLALLQLRHFFKTTFYLQNWVEGEENSDCCGWERVECDTTTGRVIKLHLSYTRSCELGEGYLNASMFSPLQELEFLDLSWNCIAGWFENTGLERLSRLKVLDLSGNMYNNSILSSLIGLSSLKDLYLNQNRLKGTVDVQGLDSLSNLEVLDMSGHKIDKFVFPKDCKGLRKLNTLYLGNLKSTDGSTLLQSLGSFSSLKKLDLSNSNFSEKMTTKELHNLTNVEDLILDATSLDISILQTIGAFNSLKHLSMKNCKLNGTLSNQGALNFKILKSLLMDGTTLKNSFFQIIKKMTSLKILSLSSCGLEGMSPMEGLCELEQLQKLYIKHNDLRGILPSCFANLTSLQLLDVSFNHIIGNISSSPLKDLISIRRLRLSNNHFQIPISLEPFFNHSELKSFHGDNNQIYKEIESHSLVPQFQLNSFILCCYEVGGTFPKFLYHQRDLEEIDLCNMDLKGEFPNWLIDNNTKLETLLLVNNSLSGDLWLPNHSHNHLTTLDISMNSFYGHIPEEVGIHLPRLKYFNISKNRFSGNIPSSIGDMNLLKVLDFSSNLLSGEIPERLAIGCSSLQLLVLSNNNLQGQIFSGSFNLTNLLTLQLDNNNFTRNIPESLFNCSLLEVYLGNNHLSGNIPGWLGNMSELVGIRMPNNHFEGPIPYEFCRLNFLEVLDLARNNISGSLPSCFKPFLIREVHLSRNRLQGQLIDAFYYSLSLETLDLGYNLLNGSLPNWIGRLSLLRFLILRNNYFEGELPLQLCELEQLRIMDFSSNNLRGYILSCLKMTENLGGVYDVTNLRAPNREQEIEFTTKTVTRTYRGRILAYMSGIDLSCNKLTGQIPIQMGNLTSLLGLNLSHNNLIGPIPETLSKLEQMESLDLSYNNLSDKIPSKFTKLLFLAVFSVAFNNLSGKVPDTAQFSTLDVSSYKGNPLLCGPPLSKICSTTKSPSLVDKAEDSNVIDMAFFYISFTVSYIIMLLGFIVILYVNPYWRQTWFNFVEMWMTSCYYFVVDHLP